MKFDKKTRFTINIELEDWEALDLRSGLGDLTGHADREDAAVQAFYDLLCEQLSDKRRTQCGQRLVVHENGIEWFDHCAKEINHPDNYHTSNKHQWGVETKEIIL